MMEGVWQFNDDFSQMPYAGKKEKVLTVDPKQKYFQDNYKAVYEGKNAPFGTYN